MGTKSSATDLYNDARQILGRSLAVAVHQNHQTFALFVLHHQRFNHMVLGYTKLPGRFSRSAMLNVVVGMFGVSNFILL
jgi:hypothetical protein